MEFKEGADELIPEKWCVRRTPENAEVLNAWFESFCPAGFSPRETVSGIFIWQYGWCVENIQKLPEIHYEQWKEIPEIADWLKQKEFEDAIKQTDEAMKEEREILGYDLAGRFSDGRECRTRYIKALQVISCTDFTDNGKGNVLFTVNSSLYNIFKNDELLHWFDPIYKEEKMTEDNFFNEWKAFFSANTSDGRIKKFKADIKKLLEDNK